jgi:UPF0755 protein
VTDSDIILRPGDSRDRRHVRRQRRSFAAVLVSLVILGALATGLVLGGQRLFDGFIGGPDDYSGPGSGSVTIQVPDGAGGLKIGQVLLEAEVVKSVGAFTAAFNANKDSRGIQPGFYKMRKHMKASDALLLLLDPKARLRARLTIPEGFTVKQTLAKIAKDSKIPLKDLQAVAAKPAKLGLPAYANGQLEGFLFPATYDIQPNATATTVLKQMVTQFKSEAKRLRLEERAAEKNITPREAVIVASLVEEETRIDKERPKVARVIYNRLRKDMALQIDATIQYLLPKPKNPLLTADLEIDSPYNTYKYTGLPPGPIAGPGAASLEAALAPADGTWLYYVVINKKGEHGFTPSYNEFLRLKAKGKKATGG